MTRMHTRILIALFVGLILGYMIGWRLRNDGKVMASAQNNRLPGQPRIVIRQVPEAEPFFGLDFESLESNYLYRFEYYVYSSGVVYSCQTFTGRSYKANNAQIEWNSTGTAIASLDHNPEFKCDAHGAWTEIGK